MSGIEFSVSKIFREISFGNSKIAKSAIFPHLEALNFEFLLKSTKLMKFRDPKMAKTAVLALLDYPKLISRKI